MGHGDSSDGVEKSVVVVFAQRVVISFNKIDGSLARQRIQLAFEGARGGIH